MYEYKAKVIRVVDGDTIEAIVDLGMDVFQKTTLRLYGIDTPETYRPKCKAEKDHGLMAKKMVEDLVLDEDVVILTHKDKTGKYGRYLADILIKEKGLKFPSTLVSILKREGMEKRDYTIHEFSEFKISGKCLICGGEGKTLPSQCPGRPMTDDEKVLVSEGKVTYNQFKPVTVK